ncbi:MAG: hypothetical protein H6737_03290 [Alphaproteobacteria bacterium]|nr:hypothetical protein [Alphaproteobacteria bacterium]
MIALAWLVPAAFAWPADGDWVVLERNTIAYWDEADDVLGADPSIDLVGVDPDGVVYWSADVDAMFLRLRLVGDPQAAPGVLHDRVWGFLVETTGNGVVEQVVVVEGSAGELSAYPNQGGVAGTQPGFAAYGAPLAIGDLSTGDVRRMAAPDGTFFLDVRVPVASLDALGVPRDAPLRLAAVTGTSLYLPWSDLSACDESPAVAACSSFTNVRALPFVLDSDADGLPDLAEDALDLDPFDVDSDDDGIPDGAEALEDTDGDGDIDPLDCDSDNDGIRDSVESGLVTGLPDTAANGCFTPDADPSTTTDPRVVDSDGGGLPDGIEDWNRNGAVDPWETDPTEASDDLDTDGDTIADVLELLAPDGSIDDEDSDGDGLSDFDERLYDVDGDGIPNFFDDDSDGDGLPDGVETAGDRDNDGWANFEDADADGDGIPDAVEGLDDPDGDGSGNAVDLDSDGDGVLDRFEGAGDPDGDGIPNYLDDDSDGDGLTDMVEGNRDPDDDGVPNFLDLDSDNDGLTDAFEGDGDPDLDFVPNFEDRNSDGQGATDGAEGQGDGDCDGIPDWLDTDEEDSFCDPMQPLPEIDPDVPPEPGLDPAIFGEGDWTGGSCSTSGSGFAWLGLIAAFLVRRRVAVGLLASAPAMAQGVDAQRFLPSVDGQTFAKVEDLDLREAGASTFAAWVAHTDDPLVFRPTGEREVEVLGSVTTTILAASHSFGPARVGVATPVHLGASGYGLSAPVHLGDVRLSGKLRVATLEVGEGMALRLGAAADAILPTGTASAWLGSDRPWVRAALVGELAAAKWRVALDLGGRSGTGGELGALRQGAGLAWALGGAYAITPQVFATLELDGDAWSGSGASGVPMEWLAGFRYRPERPWALAVAGGTGLGRGIGAPEYRAVGGVTVTPVRRSFDQAEL